MNPVGIIIIGRNEGERLRRCLASAAGHGGTVVYVDSNSTDGSAALGRLMGAQVVELDLSLPFTAARARNAGFDCLVQSDPMVQWVQFIDGDCELADGWIERARIELELHGGVAAVCGRRRERRPGDSIYNRLADLEWDTPIGEAQSCGGDAMVRAEAFRDAGGFDPSIVAGEEPELCGRFRKKGWKIIRMDAEMTLHDSAMLHFSQWWRRAVRSGYGWMDVATRRRGDTAAMQHVRSARIWGIGWPMAVLLAGIAGAALGGPAGCAIAALVLFAALPAQMFRVAMKSRRRLPGASDALACGFLLMLGKWANLAGQLQYYSDRRTGRGARLIEYKQPAPVAKPSGA